VWSGSPTTITEMAKSVSSYKWEEDSGLSRQSLNTTSDTTDESTTLHGSRANDLDTFVGFRRKRKNAYAEKRHVSASIISSLTVLEERTLARVRR
jgi:hypothetical protein